MREILQEKFVPTSSSLVEYLIYDRNIRTLEVKYKSGRMKDMTKVYYDVSEDDYNNIIHAQSVGKTLLKTVSKFKKDQAKSASFAQKLMKRLSSFFSF